MDLLRHNKTVFSLESCYAGQCPSQPHGTVVKGIAIRLLFCCYYDKQSLSGSSNFSKTFQK